MIVFVNDKPALIKSGSSFEYVVENRLFLGRDGYTMNIAFPMVDCPQNRAIFGHINRFDVWAEKIVFECIIQDRELSLVGTLLITEVSDTEVQGQFTEGRCEQTVNNPFEEVYINQDIYWEKGAQFCMPPSISSSFITPRDAWAGLDGGKCAVALPWINEAFAATPNNNVTFVNGQPQWAIAEPEKTLSWQFYLIHIAKCICTAVGYSYDFQAWEESKYKYLIVCNTLPASWGLFEFRSALPEWTVSEFFEKLELFLQGEFNFDHRKKTVTFRFTRDVLEEVEEVELKNVVDEYSSEVSTEEDADCDYIGAKVIKYKEPSSEAWKYFSCDDVLLNNRFPVKRYKTINELIIANYRKEEKIEGALLSDDAKMVGWGEQTPGEKLKNNVQCLLYAEDIDTYFCFRSIGTEQLYTEYAIKGGSGGGWVLGRAYNQVYALQPINIYGCGSTEEDHVEELEFVPATVLDTDEAHGLMLFLSFSDYDETNQQAVGVDDDYSTKADDIRQPRPAQAMLEDRDKGRGVYYDSIFVAYWDGRYPGGGKMPDGIIPTTKQVPYPGTDIISMRPDWTYEANWQANFRLTGRESSRYKYQRVNPSQKYKFSWLSDVIPNPRAIFNVRGRRYLCQKITATFTENGRSQLLKGEFYPIDDAD